MTSGAELHLLYLAHLIHEGDLADGFHLVDDLHLSKHNLRERITLMILGDADAVSRVQRTDVDLLRTSGQFEVLRCIDDEDLPIMRLYR